VCHIAGIGIFKSKKKKMSQFINYHSLLDKADIDRTDEAQPSSEHRCLALAQPQANGDTGIKVTSPAVMSEKGYYVPSGIWMSKEYKQSVELNKSN